MKKVIFLLILSLFATAASASCYGTKSFQTCYDDQSGNNYTVQRYGNTTHMDGHNQNTGSNWSQDTYRYGNTTQHYGRDSDGDSWSETCINGRCF